jgi:competence protein ComEC
VWLVIAFEAGLATGLARFPALIVVLAASLLVAVGCRRRQGVALIAAVFVGLLSAAVALERGRGECATRLPRGELVLVVRTAEPVDSGGSRSRARPVEAGCRGEVAARWPRQFAAPAGVLVEARARWRPRPGRFGRPSGMLSVASVRVLRVDPTVSERLRTAIHESSRRLYGTRAPIVDALVLGRTADVDRGLMESFSSSGLIHLLSISGFHVGLLAAWAYSLLRLARVRAPRALVGAASFAILYVAFLGWPAPATRAVALAAALATARVRQRHPQPGAVLASTALAVLLLDPWAGLDLGGWLSVSALWGADTLSRWVARRGGRGAGWRTLAASTGATLATAPITAAALGTVSIAGILLNFAAIPIAAVAVPAVVASLAIAPVLRPLADALAAGAGLGLWVLESLARAGAAIPHGHLVMAAGPRAAVPWLLLLGVGAWTIGGRSTRAEAGRRSLLVATVGVWASLVVLGAPRADGGSGLALHFLDVGQGDAAAIRTPGGHWLLVDAGPRTPGSDAGRSVVVPFLRRHGVRRLELIALSHAHADHLGGLPAVLDRVPAAEVLDPAALTDDPLYTSFLSQLEETETAWVPARRGDAFDLDGVQFRVLHPDTLWSGWGTDLNEDSIVLLVGYGRFQALLGGDAGLPVETVLHGQVGAVEVLKVGHHGSRGATGEAWLRELHPVTAVISVGENRYGHPSPEALGRLAAAGVEVWRTDREGTVSISTDGKSFTVRARRGSVTHPASDP